MAKDDTWHGFNFNVCHGRTLGFSKLPDLILAKRISSRSRGLTSAISAFISSSDNLNEAGEYLSNFSESSRMPHRRGPQYPQAYPQQLPLLLHHLPCAQTEITFFEIANSHNLPFLS